MNLLGAGTVATCGRRFKAVNAKSKSFTLEKLRRKIRGSDAVTAPITAELDRADAAEAESEQRLPKARQERPACRSRFLLREMERRGRCGASGKPWAGPRCP